MIISRREFLVAGVVGGAGLAALTVPLGASVQSKSASRLARDQMPKPYATTFVRPGELAWTDMADAEGPYRFASVTEEQAVAAPRILPKLDTTIWGYNGQFPAPTISVEQGTRSVLQVRNRLPATHPQFGYPFNTSVHLHGSASLPQYDGYANDITAPGFYKDYHYPNIQAARTLWYHDHGVHHTARNVYSGLAGQYHLHDATERSLLPQGEFDVPITISDAMFASDGSLAFDDRNMSGLWGDVILVNGQPWPVLKVKRRVYRFRILNASISRSYRPTLSNGDPVTMVATDAGLMPTSAAVTNWRHGSAERYETLIDFAKYQVGQRIELRNLSNPNNVNYLNTNKIMAFDVVDGSFDTTNNTIPKTLVPSPVMQLTERDSLRTRRFRFQRSDVTNMWTIDGKTWMDVVDSGFKLVLANPDLDDVEIWEFENSSGGWFHPVHIHLVDFQILSRNGRPPFAYERGPKDVVYVGEGETVRLLMRFEHRRGRYMIHCHNLVHEDDDMMQQFSVGLVDFDNDPNNPITADPPRVDDLP